MKRGPYCLVLLKLCDLLCSKSGILSKSVTIESEVELREGWRRVLLLWRFALGLTI